MSLLVRSLRPGGVVLALGLTVPLLSLPDAVAAPRAPQTPAGVTAYVYGNQPSTSSYGPERGYSFNSTGGAIRIHRSAAGTYLVKFFGLGSLASQGTVNVTAEGLQPAMCTVVRWKPDSTGTILLVSVDCYSVEGAPQDAPFMATFTSGGSSTGTLDYVWANQPTTHSYTPSLPYQFNSSGGTNTITRLGAGRYEVILPGPVVADGTVKVTAYGSDPDSCQVVEWIDATPGQEVFVDCFNTTGGLADHRFTMTFAATDGLLGDGGPSGYLWANDSSSSSYTPDTLYQWDTAATTANAQKLETGEWALFWPSEAQGATGDQQATAYGSTEAHCIVDGPVGGSDGQEQGDVFCFDNNGNLVDTLYTSQFVVK